MQLTENTDSISQPTARRLYRCRCGRPIFFRNSYCIACQTPLGYDPHRGELLPLEGASQDGTWVSSAESKSPTARRYIRCANLESAAGCNWLIPVDGVNVGVIPALCIACRLNRTIPDLSVQDNPEKWRRIEIAKRRLVSSLVRLGLPVASKLDEDPQRGLVFDFLSSQPHEESVKTGHDDGVVTLNIDEADHAKREQMRVAMGEPYRTILGHLRHEVGHYYWDRLVAGTERQQAFRELFGDERADYGDALQLHYQQGPPPNWPEQFVSAYATSHPWEDWAETWAHYLHMTDTLDTALSFRLELDDAHIPLERFTEEVLYSAEPPGTPPFLPLLNGWIQLTAALNELSLSMGLKDFYPFVLSRAAVTKLHFVHLAVHDSAEESGG